MEKKLELNIRYFYLNRFFRQLVFFLPIWVLYFMENGLSMTQVLITSTTMIVASQIFEIPSGIFADLYGRKKSLIISASLYIVAISILSISHSFPVFLIGEIFSGISLAFSSGSIDALVYDSLFDLNRKKDFMKISGHSFFISNIAMAGASIIGGIVASFSLRYAMILTLVPACLLFINNLFFYEPAHHKKLGDKYFIKHYKESFDFSKNHKTIIALIFYNGIYLSFMFIFFNFLQPYLKSFGLIENSIGYFYAFFLLTSAFASKYTNIIEEKIGEKLSLYLVPILLMLSFLIVFSAENLFIAIIGVLLVEFSWGFFNPLVSTYINHHIPASYRATIVSFKGFVFGFLTLIFAPLLGFLKDSFSFRSVFLAMFILSVISFFLVIFVGGDKKNVRQDR